MGCRMFAGHEASSASPAAGGLPKRLGTLAQPEVEGSEWFCSLLQYVARLDSISFCSPPEY